MRPREGREAKAGDEGRKPVELFSVRLAKAKPAASRPAGPAAVKDELAGREREAATAAAADELVSKVVVVVLAAAYGKEEEM